MNPLVVLAGAAAALVGYRLLSKKKEEAPAANPALGQASELQQGKSYTILHATAPLLQTEAVRLNTTPEALITSMMTQAGFEVLNKPTFKDNFAILAFQQGKPTTWVYNVKWTRPEKYVQTLPPSWSGQTAFYPLPIS